MQAQSHASWDAVRGVVVCVDAEHVGARDATDRERSAVGAAVAFEREHRPWRVAWRQRAPTARWERSSVEGHRGVEKRTCGVWTRYRRVAGAGAQLTEE